MEEYQERVVAEQEALDEKRVKLRAFIGSRAFYDIMMSPEERERMRRQLGLMDDYSAVLAERIYAWTTKERQSE